MIQNSPTARNAHPRASSGLLRRRANVHPLSPAAAAAAVMSLLAAVSMQGCGVTPMTEEACLDLDWAEMGAERGLRGQEPACLTDTALGTDCLRAHWARFVNLV